MNDTYSVYEAKAKLSEILRRVREGQTVTISYHGKPVAEVKPVEQAGASRPFDMEAHVRHLEAIGALSPDRGPYTHIKPLARRPGGLKRFLEDRSRF
jgi:prevent-host-death family protein